MAKTAHINIMTNRVNKKITPAEPQVEALANAVALRITALRKSRNLTLGALALRAQVSKGTLVLIEQERANPSIATLCRLAAALGTSVADLVAPPQSPESAVTVVDAANQRVLWSGPSGGSARLLAGSAGPDMLELWSWDLRPGERFAAVHHQPGTREILHVTAGTLSLETDGAETLIAAGSSAIARTDRPHAYANRGKSSVRFLMTVHEPAATA